MKIRLMRINCLSVMREVWNVHVLLFKKTLFDYDFTCKGFRNLSLRSKVLIKHFLTEMLFYGFKYTFYLLAIPQNPGLAQNSTYIFNKFMFSSYFLKVSILFSMKGKQVQCIENR